MNYITQGNGSVFEQEPLIGLAKDGQAITFKHDGWMPMDTLRDKMVLTKFWEEEKASWKTW